MDQTPEWDGQKAIDDVLASLRSKPEETPESLALEELKKAFPAAVKSLVNIAMHSRDDKLRRLASLDIVNANVKIKEIDKPLHDHLADFIKSVTVEDPGHDEP